MLGLKGEIDTDTRNRSEHVPAPYERQRLPLPLRKPRFLQQFLDQSPRPVDRELDALAAEARANHHRRRGDLRHGEPVTFRTLEYNEPFRRACGHAASTAETRSNWRYVALRGTSIKCARRSRRQRSPGWITSV